MIKQRTREQQMIGNNGEEQPMQQQPMQQPLQEPVIREKPFEEEMLEAVGNMQEAIANITSRMDKIENKPIEDEQQEIPAMEQNNNLPPFLKKKNEEDTVEEEVHVGGDNEAGDLEPMDKKGKLSGPAEDPKNVFQEMRRMIKRLEELTGTPEIPKGKKENPMNQTQGIPQSTQPASGTAPSGGGFDSDDKIADDEADDAVRKVDKPKKDFSKPAAVYNKVNKEAGPGEPLDGSKGIQKEGEDPTEPQPGETQKKPDSMDMNPPEKNVVEETYKELMDNIEREKLMKRQSVVEGFTERMSKIEKPAESFNKVKATNMIKEYLKR